jgi:hypothetical protein
MEKSRDIGRLMLRQCHDGIVLGDDAARAA